MEQLCYIHFELLNHKTQEGYWATDKGLQVKHLPEVISKSKGKTATGFYNIQTQRFRLFSYSEQDWNSLFQEYIFHDKVTDKFYYLYLLRILNAINTSKFQYRKESSCLFRDANETYLYRSFMNHSCIVG